MEGRPSGDQVPEIRGATRNRSSTTGSAARGHMRENSVIQERKSQALSYVSKALEHVFDKVEQLRDGTLLCRWLNALFPGTVPVVEQKNRTHKIQNAFSFIVACRQIGVQDYDMISADTIIDKSNWGAVREKNLVNLVLAIKSIKTRKGWKIDYKARYRIRAMSSAESEATNDSPPCRGSGSAVGVGPSPEPEPESTVRRDAATITGAARAPRKATRDEESGLKQYVPPEQIDYGMPKKAEQILLGDGRTRLPPPASESSDPSPASGEGCAVSAAPPERLDKGMPSKAAKLLLGKKMSIQPKAASLLLAKNEVIDDVGLGNRRKRTQSRSPTRNKSRSPARSSPRKEAKGAGVATPISTGDSKSDKQSDKAVEMIDVSKMAPSVDGGLRGDGAGGVGTTNGGRVEGDGVGTTNGGRVEGDRDSGGAVGGSGSANGSANPLAVLAADGESSSAPRHRSLKSGVSEKAARLLLGDNVTMKPKAAQLLLGENEVLPTKEEIMERRKLALREARVRAKSQRSRKSSAKGSPRERSKTLNDKEQRKKSKAALELTTVSRLVMNPISGQDENNDRVRTVSNTDVKLGSRREGVALPHLPSTSAHVVKEGYMEKRGASQLSGYQERFFQLLKRPHFGLASITYSLPTEARSHKERGEIILIPGSTIVSPCKKVCEFTITVQEPKKRTYHIRARTRADRDQWVHAVGILLSEDRIFGDKPKQVELEISKRYSQTSWESKAQTRLLGGMRKVCEGFLRKRGGKSASRPYKRRFFRLVADTTREPVGQLNYHADNRTYEVLGSVEIIPQRTRVWVDPHNDKVFFIKNPQRKYVLKASTKDDQEYWVEKLREILDFKAQDLPNPTQPAETLQPVEEEASSPLGASGPRIPTIESTMVFSVSEAPSVAAASAQKGGDSAVPVIGDSTLVFGATET